MNAQRSPALPVLIPVMNGFLFVAIAAAMLFGLAIGLHKLNPIQFQVVPTFLVLFTTGWAAMLVKGHLELATRMRGLERRG